MTQPPTPLSVFIVHSNSMEQLAQEVSEFVQAQGHIVLDPFAPGRCILDSVHSALAGGHMVIALIDEASANVFFELGYAAALGKRIALITSASSPVPFDIRDFPCVVMGAPPHEWRHELARILESAFSDAVRERAVDPLRRDLCLQTDRLLSPMPVIPGSSLKGLLRRAAGQEHLCAHLLHSLEREADLLEVVAGILRARGGALLHEPTIRAASHTLRPDIMVRDAEGNLIVVECKMRAAGALLSIAPLQQLERYLEWLSQPARGLLVTTGHLSEAALHYAESSNARIELWDGNRLLDELARVQQGDEAADAAT